MDERDIDRVLDLLLSVPAAKRAALLDRECAGDAALRARLDRLLDGYAGAATFDTPVLELLRPGITIGDRFILERQLGAGAFGAVWLCRDERGAHCAVKMPRRDSLEGPGVVDAFKREVFRWIRLGDHPHIVHAYGMIDVLRLPAVIMEYVADAISLETAMESTRFEWRTALSFGAQIAAGMAYAYDHVGLVHNDLKPGNVIMLPGGRLKIADFGIAVAHGIEPPSRESELGSIPYMAPERWLGIRSDTRSDIYSTGVLLFEVIAGVRPFPDHDDPELFGLDHRSTPAPDIRGVADDVPAPLAALIASCLEKQPGRRPQDFHALGRELRRIAGAFDVAIPQMDESPAPRPNNAEGAVNLAITLHGLNRLDEAEATAREAVKADPRYSPGWHVLGNVLLSARRWPDAIRAFIKVQQLDPSDLIAVQGLVSAYCGAGSQREALAWMTQAFARAHDAQTIERLEALPESLLQMNQPRMALHLCEAILERNPLAIRAWNSRAMALRRLEDYEAALSSVKRAIELNAAYPPAWTNCATILTHLHQWDGAIEAADRALSLDETIANAYLAKAVALRARDQIAEAKACILRGLSFRPDNVLLIRALGAARES